MAPARPSFCRTACLFGSLAVVAILAFRSPAARADGGDDADGTGKKTDKPELLKEAQPPASRPAAKPSTQPAIEVSPEVRVELDALADAYRGLKSLRLAGKISADLDINGEQRRPTATFESSFEAPAKFRHAATDEGEKAGKTEDLVVGSTGEKLYVFQPLRKRYQTAEAPKGRTSVTKLGEPFGEVLIQQDPSLVLALSEDPAAEVLDGTKAIEKAPDVTIGGTAYTALKLTESSGDRITMLIDPKTHLLRRFVMDMRKTTDPDGKADVKKAEVTIDYADVEPGVKFPDERFAWTPPKGAKEVTASAAVALGGGGGDFPALAMEGKAAPDFKLAGMDDKEVSLADLKGSVVLIDFWATWCGPCRASLPHLNDIYKDKKDAGLKAFAIDLKEDKDLVEKFVKETKLTIPVLLDGEGSVGEKYQVSGIPQTVVIGKDGKIVKVVVGAGSHDEVRKAIEEALK